MPSSQWLLLGLLLLASCAVCCTGSAAPKLSAVHISGATLVKKKERTLISYLPTGVRNGLASALAAAVVKMTLQPIDTIKTVQQMHNYQMGILGTALSFVEKRGVLGLWAGTGVTVLGSAPSVAVYFGIFNSCKGRFAELLPSSYRPLAVALAAMVGNTIASVLRVPYEVSPTPAPILAPAPVPTPPPRPLRVYHMYLRPPVLLALPLTCCISARLSRY
jgi:hypothetical protein